MEALHKKVSEFVNEFPGAALVFKRHQIDFCCGGKRSLEKACSAKNIDPMLVLEEIENEMSQSPHFLRFQDWPAGLLCDYIVHNHHGYVRKTLPQLLEFSKKVAAVHGESHPELIELYSHLRELSNELTAHLEDEEKNLFPKLKEAKTVGNELLNDLEEEHLMAGNLMQQIRDSSNDFSPPADACQTYKVLYQLLESFEQDLHQHVHLENNVLFEKVRRKQ